MGRDDGLVNSARLAAVAEVAYRRADGTAGAAALTPLVWDDRPAFALPYARAELADRLAESPTVAVAFSDSRLALKGWEPLVATATSTVVADPHGERFHAHLLHQELRKYPPSRLLLDTPLLRREYWWYLPRFLVRLREVRRLRPIGRRRPPDDALLAWVDGDLVEADSVEVRNWDDPQPWLRSLAGHALGGVQDRSGVLFRHDFAIPGMDRWTAYEARGRLDRGRFTVEGRTGTPSLEPPRSLLGRLRALRALERGCRRGLLERGAPA